MIKFYCYPKCSTCKDAKKWLDSHKVKYQEIHIVEANPSKEELTKMHQLSGLPIQRLFNTSGLKYRELGLKDVVKTAELDELLSILATDGMLVKRPIMTDGKKVTVGFKEDIFKDTWGNG